MPTNDGRARGTPVIAVGFGPSVRLFGLLLSYGEDGGAEIGAGSGAGLFVGFGMIKRLAIRAITTNPMAIQGVADTSECVKRSPPRADAEAIPTLNAATFRPLAAFCAPGPLGFGKQNGMGLHRW
jgi:hypothetical protein